jgi:hypothetical protein
VALEREAREGSQRHQPSDTSLAWPSLAWPIRRGSAEDDSFEEEESEEEDPGKASREPHVPCDFRLYEQGGKIRNEHFRDMLDRAAERKFAPEIVLFDS